MCLWQAWSPSRSTEGHCHQGDTCPTEQRRASELPWNGNISLTIHSTAIFSHSNTQRTAEDWCQILLECYISSHIWQAQIIGMWGGTSTVTIQVNASGEVLGATLNQDNVQSPLLPRPACQRVWIPLMWLPLHINQPENSELVFWSVYFSSRLWHNLFYHVTCC